jgi:membrane protease YdiL (CAAX protease family)
MSSDVPPPSNPDEAISPVPLGPPADDAIPLVQPALAFRRKARPMLAWLVILLFVSFSILSVKLPKPLADAGRMTRPQLAEQLEIRYLVGAADLLPRTGGGIYGQVKGLERGPALKRLNFVVLAGELRGPDEALASLERIDPATLSQLTGERAALPDILRRLYRDYQRKDFNAASVTSAERELLVRELGWVGKLALHSAGDPDPAARAGVLADARRTFVCLIVPVLLFIFFGLVGLVGVIWLLSEIHAGREGSRLARASGTGALYVESFAVWLLLFTALSGAVSLLPASDLIFVLLGLAALLAFAGGLAWPVLWGVRWRQVRQEIGLFAGQHPLRELGIGIGCYIMALPFVAVGLLLTVMLMRLQGWATGQDAPTPYHPVTESLDKAGWAQLVQLLIFASVVAPIVEETMFRGMFYRHLREVTGKWGGRWSILFSAVVVSFVFAVIHPQGVLAVPALMSLAIAFSLAREWRGSLLPAIVAHGLNNAIVLTLATLLFSGG